MSRRPRRRKRRPVLHQRPPEGAARVGLHRGRGPGLGEAHSDLSLQVLGRALPLAGREPFARDARAPLSKGGRESIGEGGGAPPWASPHHEGRCAGVGSEPPCCPRLEGHLVGPEARRLGAQAAVRGGIPRSF